VSTTVAPPSFSVTRNPVPASERRVAEVLADPRFGKYFTDHMVTIRYSGALGWHDAAVGPHEPLALSPCAAVLHYGQAVFEGLKAYRQLDGSIACFRPWMNAARFRSSARRLAMPELPEETFLAALGELVRVDERWVPEAGEKSLYLRPLMVSTSPDLLVTPADEYLFVVVASPAGAYYAGGVEPVTVWLSRDYVRAAPGGTGHAKFAGNYAGAFVAQRQAVEAGCDQVVWLDAVERRWVEEMGVNNLFFVFGSGPDARVVTPALTGSLLPGVTRDSVLRLVADLGYAVEERPVSTEEWESAATSGELTEVFACGTAAVITPVGTVRHADGEFTIGGHRSGSVTMLLRERLTAIQRGAAPDPHAWMHKIG
jgi:branched-chain amino acid aminotransferase